ncbi:hypothetical protein [Lysinibacillus sphaericus]|uniref:hypothetical protein n=1 Tax=Lysinibacillus sphaericus TaxID=1421 RepID=UPI0018CDA587|nr:hypothetical protein [Lysinibacillus sphaericus]
MSFEITFTKNGIEFIVANTNNLKLPISTFLRDGGKVINETLDTHEEHLGGVFSYSLREEMKNDLELHQILTIVWKNWMVEIFVRYSKKLKLKY